MSEGDQHDHDRGLDPAHQLRTITGDFGALDRSARSNLTRVRASA
jgi:hypothetical protein